MTAQLTVHNAEIHTATVEIKTLTVSGKQVTLAVFRQLREEALIAEDGTLNGVPWGTVNYHPDKCATNQDGYPPKHVHVVWQKGLELRRGRVSKPNWDADFWDERIDGLRQADFCTRGHTWAVADRFLRFTIDGVHCRANDGVEAARAEGHECEPFDRALQAAREAIAGEKARRARRNEGWKLFIAV